MLKEEMNPETRRRVSAAGGKASAAKLTPQQRSERARRAAYGRHHRARRSTHDGGSGPEGPEPSGLGSGTEIPPALYGSLGDVDWLPE